MIVDAKRLSVNIFGISVCRQAVFNRIIDRHRLMSCLFIVIVDQNTVVLSAVACTVASTIQQPKPATEPKTLFLQKLSLMM
jgi:hypothetical protein